MLDFVIVVKNKRQLLPPFFFPRPKTCFRLTHVADPLALRAEGAASRDPKDFPLRKKRNHQGLIEGHKRGPEEEEEKTTAIWRVHPIMWVPIPPEGSFTDTFATFPLCVPSKE